jgi:cobalt-zinc-cadmium efflux system outer membrane protein
VFPNGASLGDGITEDEAVLIAPWNNAAFQALLVELDLARADLIDAGLLPNPELVYFFPVTDKPYKYAMEFPLEALWLRPIKIAAAGRESARVCQRRPKLVWICSAMFARHTRTCSLRHSRLAETQSRSRIASKLAAFRRA